MRQGDHGLVPQRTRPELEPFVYDFARRLREEVGAETVILFGSRARGDWLKESDYDFIVVSQRFQEVPWPHRPVELYRLWAGSPGVELLCYTPEEFQRKRRQISVVAEALREGIQL
jgi:predicted nucleotidyltransferase